MTTQYWTCSSSHAKCSAGELSASVKVDSDHSPPLLSLQTAGAPAVGLCVKSLGYLAENGKRVRAPIVPGVFQRNEPYLVVPMRVDSDVGLRLVIQFLSEPNLVTADFRIETVAPVRSLWLNAEMQTTAGEWSPALLPPRNAPEAPASSVRALDLTVQTELAGLMLADLGEEGEANATPLKDTWNLTYFQQPLEKGVILVGRWGWAQRPRDTSPDVFRGELIDWHERRTFL